MNALVKVISPMIAIHVLGMAYALAHGEMHTLGGYFTQTRKTFRPISRLRATDTDRINC
jgi:hypothetical protein